EAMDRLETASCSVSRTDRDNVVKYTVVSEGTLKYMKPKHWVLELRRKDKPEEFEKLMRSEMLLYQFDSKQKKVIELKLLQRGFEGKHSTWLDFWRGKLGGALLSSLEAYSLLGMKPEEAKRLFSLTICKGKEKDPHYIYIDIRPRDLRDTADFQQARIVL